MGFSAMIKWFDTDRFFPGKSQREVLVRVIQNNIINKPTYHMSFYDCGEWLHETGSNIEEDECVVTHWACINEPLE